MISRIFTLFTCICLSCFCFTANASPQKELWPRWEANKPTSTQVIDFQPWQDFLNRYVTTNYKKINVVDYAHVTKNDRAALAVFLQKMSAVQIAQYNRNEQLAYWINLYNALTVNTVLNHYPVKSIRDIHLSSGWFNTGPWDAKLIKVDGVPLSLNDIENRIIRPIWNDPRTHYGLNCASYGCPNLQKTAFTGLNVNLLLDKAAVEYVNNTRGVDIKKGKLIVSKIYIWYKPDFGESNKSIIAHLIRYAKPALKSQLNIIHRISGSTYDWSLNQPN